MKALVAQDELKPPDNRSVAFVLVQVAVVARIVPLIAIYASNVVVVKPLQIAFT